MNKLLLTIGLLFLELFSFSQEEHDPNKESDTHSLKHNRISVFIGHGHVIGAETTSGKKMVVIPTWGIEYAYRINHHISLALKSDVEIFEYIVEDDEGTKISRENPLIVSVLFAYHIKSGFIFFTGPGIEFEKAHNFFIYRIGANYEFHIAKHWDFAPEIVFDLKNGSIGSFTWGIGVGKSF